MSTAGKVLTVLILLVMVAWLMVLSGITQLNVNWQDRIAKQDKQLESIQAETDKAAKDILRITEAARLEQDATDRDLRDVLGRIATAERRQSATVESLTRLKKQVDDYRLAVDRSKANLDNREGEKAKAEEDLVKKRDEIAKAQALNADLRGQLATLQDEFKKLLSENAAKVGQLTKDAPAATSASRRPSPST